MKVKGEEEEEEEEAARAGEKLRIKYDYAQTRLHWQTGCVHAPASKQTIELYITRPNNTVSAC